MTRSVLAAALAMAVLVPQVAAQSALGDVELLGQVYGTRPPPSYYELKASRPGAFQLSRGGFLGLQGLERLRQGSVPTGVVGGAARASLLGPRQAVVGTFRFPLVLGLFSDSPETPPFERGRIQTEYFDGPNSYYGTIPELYTEMSGGLVSLVGETHDWVRSNMTRTQVAANQSALPGRVGDFIVQILAGLNGAGIDWGRYDNDGPDGVPNSGDDDGYVDLLAVLHPTQGAECDGSKSRVWSHKWSLQDALGQVFHTTTPAARGGTILVSDYTIQPAYACPSVGGTPDRINEVGVFAHELGHGFGLPDLYNNGSSSNHAGIGSWGLMGSGSWGCYGFNPSRPCHMEAWSKAMLGWVQVETLATGIDLGVTTLEPVIDSRRVLRVEAGDGSGDYFLLENRQRRGFDQGLVQPGLLVWRVDQSRLDATWPFNTVNVNPNRLGVGLMQADGLGSLSKNGGGRGDAGDPFPGLTGNRAFHAGSSPTSDSHTGAASGLTVLGIEMAGEEVRFRLLTRFQRVTLSATGASAGGSLFTVDGVPLASGATAIRAAPFESLLIEAAAGELLGPGVRRGFERWLDAPGEPRQRTFAPGLEDAELVAGYGQREIQTTLSTQGEQFGVPPGEIVTDPASSDGWFAEGATVSFTARPTTGFAFREWTGALAGQGMTASYQVNAPMVAGAVFDLTYAIPADARHGFEAAVPQEIQLVASNATPPVRWTRLSGELPDGISFGQDGLLKGGALETGAFTLQVRARDARGLEASGSLVLEVRRPTIGVEPLTAQFLFGTLGLDELQRTYLDRAGNGNGFYDLGDFRAFFLANPALPMTMQQRALVRRLLPAVDFAPLVAPSPGGRP